MRERIAEWIEAVLKWLNKLPCKISMHKYKYTYGHSMRYYKCERCGKEVNIPGYLYDSLKSSKLNMYLNEKGE